VTDLYADVDALNELSRQLQTIKTSLEGAEERFSSPDGRFGSSGIEEALEDFIDGWEDGRSQILKGIDGLIGRIQAAVDAYQKTEAEISRAVQQPSRTWQRTTQRPVKLGMSVETRRMVHR